MLHVHSCTALLLLLQLEEGPIPEWQSMPMDDAPSRSEPNGNNSRWKQAFVPAPSKHYAMEFYVQGPAPGEGVTGSASDGEGSGRSSRSQNGQVTRGSSSTRDSSVRVVMAEWLIDLAGDPLDGP